MSARKVFGKTRQILNCLRWDWKIIAVLSDLRDICESKSSEFFILFGCVSVCLCVNAFDTFSSFVLAHAPHKLIYDWNSCSQVVR